MGTNYYLYDEAPCEKCGRSAEPRHIGKSSGGWNFSLHVIPWDGLNSLEDWVFEWSKPGRIIEDEYGARIAPEDMLLIITARSWHGDEPRRHVIDGVHCVGNGSGTWDLIAGEFS